MCDILHKGKGHFKNKTEQIAPSDASVSIKQAFSPFMPYFCTFQSVIYGLFWSRAALFPQIVSEHIDE